MENFNRRDKVRFLGLELIGSALLTYALNVTSTGATGPVLLIVSILCWEASCAHFNLAVTLGVLVNQYPKAKKNLNSFLMIAVAQMCGFLIGIGLTSMSSKYDYSQDELQTKTIQPTVPVVCPNYRSLSNVSGCKAKNIEWSIIACEFIASFIYVFSWIAIRGFDLKGELGKTQALFKPILVYLTYGGCKQLTTSFSNGFFNPNIAIELAIWGRSAYNNEVKDGDVSKTQWNYYNYGNYTWVYVCTPLVAAVCAGLCVRIHAGTLRDIKKQREMHSEGVSDNSLVEEKVQQLIE